MTGQVRTAAAASAARSLASLVVLALATVAVAACTSAGASPSASTTAVTTNSPSVTASEVAASANSGTASGQTDTDWGRIWDTLPAGFPSVPGATPADETAAGPASASLVVHGKDAKGVATQMQTRLTTAGYATTGLSGPLENNGYVLDLTGPPKGCAVQVAVTPTGSLTTVTILYGAACPHA